MNKEQSYFIFICIIWFVSITTLNGQSQPNRNNYIPNIQHFSTEQGLSHREVLFIFHDRDGITWISTPNGLNRFDGYHFKHFLGKSTGIDLRNIGRITQDDEGWLWLLQDQEILFFHPQTEKTQTVAERFGEDCILLNSKRPTRNLDDFQVDNEGRIYFIIDETNLIYTYHSSEGFRKKIMPPSLPLKYKYFMSVSDDKELTFLLGSKKKNYSSYYYGVAKFILTPSSDSTYILKEKMLYFNKFNLNENQKGERWRNNRNDYFFFDENGNFLTTIKNYRKTGTDHVFIDKQDNYWISTKSGFYIIEIVENKFDLLEKSDFQSYLDVEDIIVDSTKIIFISRDYVITYKSQTKQWDNKMVHQSHDLFATDEGVWISHYNGISLLQIDKIEQFQHTKNTFERNLIEFWSIAASNVSKNHLWIGSDKGLHRFDIRTKTYKTFLNKAIKDDAYLIQNIIRDKEKEHWLWLCSNQGLILFDEQKEAFIATYDIEQAGDFFLPTEYVQHFYQDKDGVYWLATADVGIIRWDKKNNQYRQISIADGLPDNTIHCIYPDDFDHLWMSSNRGVSQLNKSTFSIKNFLPKNTKEQIGFNRISHTAFRDKAGNQQLFFGGLGGLVSFFPKDFQDTTATIKPFLALLNYQQFDGKGKEVIDYTIMVNNSRQIILNPDDYIHQIEVGLLNYTDVDKNTYHYQLIQNGIKSDWKTQKSRILQLGQLPYGTHQLIVKANTITNLKSANELVFEIIVLRPFYLTWSFLLLAFGSTFGGVFYWYKRRTTQLKRRQIELEAVVKERTEELVNDKEIIEAQSKELKEIDAIKSRFFANVSHELRTPITLIQGPIQSALNSQSLNNRNFTLLSKAKQNTKKLLQLVNEILDLTKLDGHKLELDETNIVLYTFLRQIISNFQSVADSQSIEFIFNYHPSHALQVKIDKSKFEKILNNLLSNAFKFTPKNGRIEIEVSDLGEENTNALNNSGILISVKDNGRGIPSEDVPNVFNRFYQSSTNKKAEGGLGIGLALSMEFVKLMKGKMWAESSTDDTNHGSTFFFQFPKKEVLGMLSTEKQLLIHQEETAITSNTTQNDTTTKTKKLISNDETQTTILLVEDNPDLRDYVSLILSPYYNVITAENGKEGLLQLGIKNYKLGMSEPSIPNSTFLIPNLIISDVMMPIMDGFEFLEKVKANPKWSSLPFIMLTARAEIQTKLKALRIGVDDYLLKPFEEEELLVRIANLLANYEERQAFAQTETVDETAPLPMPTISVADQEWLATVESLVLKEMNDSLFSIDYISELLQTSRRTFYKKIKQSTGLTPTKYIRTIRLQKAKSLLEQGKTVKETADEVGFQKVDYFSTLFKKEFGKSPSQYMD